MYKTSKKTSKTGAVTLTKEVRCLIGLVPGQVVDVIVNDDNTVTIKKHVASCFCCGSVEKVRKFRNYELCSECRKELSHYDEC